MKRSCASLMLVIIPLGLEGGAVDATQTTSASHLVYFGTVDRETLTVR